MNAPTNPSWFCSTCGRDYGPCSCAASITRVPYVMSTSASVTAQDPATNIARPPPMNRAQRRRRKERR